MITVPLVSGLDAIHKEYGNPLATSTELVLDRDWVSDNLVWQPLSDEVELYLSWKPEVRVTSLYGHYKVVPAMADALEAIWGVFGALDLNDWGLNRYGGIFNMRMKTGSRTELSTHSWGIAIDLNPHKWGWGKVPGTLPTYEIWLVFSAAFEARGFAPGGDFTTPDPMHWQAAEGY